jgi:hypothetical protein
LLTKYQRQNEGGFPPRGLLGGYDKVWKAMDDRDQKTEEGSEFDPDEMDKIIRQFVDKVRVNYFQNGETARGMPSEIKRIIEANINRF